MFNKSKTLYQKYVNNFFITTLAVFVFALCVVGMLKANDNNYVDENNEVQSQFNAVSGVNNDFNNQDFNSKNNKGITPINTSPFNLFNKISQNVRKNYYINSSDIKDNQDKSSTENRIDNNNVKENIFNNSLKENQSQPDLTIEQGIEGKDYNWDLSESEPKLTILSGANVTVKNMDGVEESHTNLYLENKQNTETNLSLNNINIRSCNPILIEDNSKGNVNIIVKDKSINTLKTPGDEAVISVGGAGIQKNSGDDSGILVIKSESDFVNTNTGILNVRGARYSAGIGSWMGNSASNIVIKNSIVNSQSIQDGAAIGGGKQGTASNISVINSVISGPGIGGEGGSHNIVIDGGSINCSIWGSVPTNLNGDKIHLFVLQNKESLPLKVKNISTKESFVDYGVANHTPLDPNDTNLYTYQPANSEFDCFTFKLGSDNILIYYFIHEIWEQVEYKNTGDLDVDGEYLKDYVYFKNEKKYLVISFDKKLKFKNNDISNSQIFLNPAKDQTTNIVLDGVWIESDVPIKIIDDCQGDVNITIKDHSTNILKSLVGAAIRKNSGSDSGTLTLKSQRDVLDSDTGKLFAYGKANSAGIGSAQGCSVSNISINNLNIEANGGTGGAGIGGGFSLGDTGTVENITINNSNITAIGGYKAAGIGTGADTTSYAKDITFNNSAINAIGGKLGAGIGGGNNGSVKNVTIDNSIVYAAQGSDDKGSGIGCVNGNVADDITINNSIVSATNGKDGSAGIGKGNSKNIIINDGSVNATIGCQPKNPQGQNVYLCTVQNEQSLPVSVKNINTKDSFVDYGVANHTALDPNDTNLYTYQPAHIDEVCLEIKIGKDSVPIKYIWCSEGWFVSDENIGDLEIENGDLGKDYYYSNSKKTYLILDTDKKLCIKNKERVFLSKSKIFINSTKDHTVNVILDNVIIETSNPIKISDDCKGNVNIKIKDQTTNMIKSLKGAAIQKNGNSDSGLLTIESERNILDSNTGKLLAYGSDNSAGIGSSENGLASNITIDSLNVKANGGINGAGIGGGNIVDGVDIGRYLVQNITINNSNIKSKGGANGAGIGSGHSWLLAIRFVQNITISNSTISATGGDLGTGIGTGDYGFLNQVTINDSIVSATQGSEDIGSGIGSVNGFAFDITINNSIVSASHGKSIGFGIGGLASKNIIINDGSINATIGCQPTNSQGQNVYLCIIQNKQSLPVSVKNINTKDSFVDYGVVNHTALDPNDTNLYTYQPAKKELDCFNVKLDLDNILSFYFVHENWEQVEAKNTGDLDVDGEYFKDYIYFKNIKEYQIINFDNKLKFKNKYDISNSRIFLNPEKYETANIILDGVNIESDYPIKIADNCIGNVNILLRDLNTLKATEGAGIEKNSISNGRHGILMIKSEGNNISSTSGKLIVTGSDNSAGIGSTKGNIAKNIYIDSAKIIATGGKDAAGIGSGIYGSADVIIINNSLVTAIGSGSAFGIGGSVDTKDVAIETSSVKATIGCQPTAIIDGKSVPVYPAPIYNEISEDVYINDAVAPYAVKNHKELDGDTNLYAYLPMDYNGYHGVLYTKITDNQFKYVFDKDRYVPFDDKSGLIISNIKDLSCIEYDSENDAYMINENIENPIKVTNKYGIEKPTSTRLVVKNDVMVCIELCGVNIESDNSPIEIFNNINFDTSIKLLNGTTNILKARNKGAAIQKSGIQGALQGSLSISSSNISEDLSNAGKLYAEGAAGAAGIGSASGGFAATNIDISNCIINAIGGQNAAGIGGGEFSSSDNIRINNSSVTAKGNNGAMDIGHGVSGHSFNIVINNSTVKAENIGCTPLNSDEKPVYLLTVDNPENLDVSLDNNKLPFKQHDCIKSVDNKLYLFIADNFTHSATVKLGTDKTINYVFKNGVWYEKKQ